MAARKNEQYLALYTACGNDDQLQVIDGGDDCNAETYNTVESARSRAKNHAECRRSDGEDACDYVIVKVVERGSHGDIVWK